MDLDSFHLFPVLPAELRLQIWSYTVPGPRVIEIVWEEGDAHEWVCVAASRPEPNYAMQANKEANNNFRKNWTPFCKTRATEIEADRTKYPIAYINPDIDTVYIGGCDTMNDCFSEDARIALKALPCINQLRYLAIEITEWNDRGHWPPLFYIHGKWEIGFLSLFPKLEVFTIADYDIDVNWLIRKEKRPVGEITFVEPVKMDNNNPLEMWPYIKARLDDLRKLPEGNNLPETQVKEVMRGGVRMAYE